MRKFPSSPVVCTQKKKKKKLPLGEKFLFIPATEQNFERKKPLVFRRSCSPPRLLPAGRGGPAERSGGSAAPPARRRPDLSGSRAPLHNWVRGRTALEGAAARPGRAVFVPPRARRRRVPPAPSAGPRCGAARRLRRAGARSGHAPSAKLLPRGPARSGARIPRGGLHKRARHRQTRICG